MDLPKISVITPSYNQASFIKQTIESVISQDYPNLEYIVIDGGSDDGSVEIIKSYKDKLSYWVSETDNGQAHAVNKGLKVATGDIIGWLNSDDIYLPGTLKKVARYYQELPDADVIYGNHVVTTQGGDFLWTKKELPFSLRRLEHHSYMSQPATFFKASVVEKCGILDEQLHFLLDWEYFIRLGKKCKFTHVSDVFATYRLHKVAKTAIQSGQDRFLEEKKKIVNKLRYSPTSNVALNHIYHGIMQVISILARLFVVVRSNPFNYFRYVMYKKSGYN